MVWPEYQAGVELVDAQRYNGRMPEGWRDLSKASRTAANELFVKKRWRSCASRAYYAAYAEVTYALLRVGATMPANQNNPKHQAVPNMVFTELRRIGARQSAELAGGMSTLYVLRIIADYVPATSLDESDARVAMGLMEKTFSLLKGMP